MKKNILSGITLSKILFQLRCYVKGLTNRNSIDLDKLSRQLSIGKGVIVGLFISAVAGTSLAQDFVLADTSINPFYQFKEEEFSVPSLVDLDSDNDLDLVVGGYSQGFKYYENQGGKYVEQTDEDNPFFFDGYTLVGSQATPVFVDLDGDDDLDMVSGDQSGTFYYFKNEDSTFQIQTGSDNPFDGLDVGNDSSPFFVDLDGDDDLDLVSGSLSGNFHYFKNENGVYSEKTGSDNPFNQFYTYSQSAPVFVDLDKDGDLDMVSGEDYGGFKFYQNTANVFEEKFGADNPLSSIGVDSYSKATFGDLDGDGDYDLLTGNGNGDFTLFYNGGLFLNVHETNETELDLKVFPNPANRTVRFNIEGEFNVFNLEGNKVLSGFYSSEEVDVSMLEPGCYFVKSASGVTSFAKQ